MNRILTAALFVLSLSAPAFADTVPAGATVLPHEPTGAGKPDAVSCHEVVKTGTRTRNLKCARNSDWARVNRLSPNAMFGYRPQYDLMTSGNLLQQQHSP